MRRNASGISPHCMGSDERVPTNCQQEPGYPRHRTVVFSIRYPDMTGHLPSRRCKIKGPHLIAECGEYAGSTDRGEAE